MQALRIVESFENPYARFPGLNLTFEVREGIVKHSRDFEAGEIPELDEYLPGLRPPLEAQLIDLCDEIAYNTADLDDGYLAGLVSIEEASRSVDKFRELDEALDHAVSRRAGTGPHARNRPRIDQLAGVGTDGRDGYRRTWELQSVDAVRAQPRCARVFRGNGGGERSVEGLAAADGV